MFSMVHSIMARQAYGCIPQSPLKLQQFLSPP